MKKHSISVLLAGLLAAALVGCGAGSASQAPASSAASGAGSAVEGQVASSGDMAPPVQVVEEGMVPLGAGSLKDGVYSIQVDSSSTMFNITACQLTVQDGGMTARMTMGGKGYLKVFPGTAEEAASAGEEKAIPYEELPTGEHAFTLPVEALDQGIDCAAYSKNKEKWYDRVLVFRADSLPLSAFAEGALVTPQSLGLSDGEYAVQVTLSGGSGKATVQSPAALRVEGGQAWASVIWSSSNYDYMKVDGERYDALTTEGGSAFEIPVGVFDRKMAVLADTVAMSTPHEIEYALAFDSASLAPAP